MVIAVMSHGESGYIHARDHKYKPETLWNPFTGDKCATLAGKPKVFFIQVCASAFNPFRPKYLFFVEIFFVLFLD